MRMCFWCVLAGVGKSLAAVLISLPIVLFDISAGYSAERIQVNAMEYPWSAIGRINTGSGSFCSGFLVSERHVLTAAHCLYNFSAARWRSPTELHFVAGYQGEQPLIHSPVISIRHKAGKGPPTTQDEKGLSQDWAILTLREPIGHQVGWLGLARESSKLLKRHGKHKGHLIQAGYSAATQHTVTINPNCKTVNSGHQKRVIMYNCPIMQGDSGSPLLLNEDGKFSAVAIHLTSFSANGKILDLSGVLPVTALEEDKTVLSGLGLAWGEGKSPVAGSLAAAKPIETNERLLRHLGYLEHTRSPAKANERHAAVEAFIAEQKSGTGMANEMGLLSLLLAALPQ